ncbi:MAG: 4-hydroxy-tetrahydrodipicolinate reductase [Halobacteriales archaeon]|jgi:4-hydroxy-tetrahydrodipicolinate reductase
MIGVVVTGATGRMGSEVIDAAGDRSEIEVVGAVSRSGPAVVGGVDVAPVSDLATRLVERTPDALVDFTAPGASVEYVATAAEAGVPAVVGTTGFDDDQDRRLRAAADSIPVLRASNFARGVEALRGALRSAVSRLPEYDVEVTETHHAGKRDAPSGTALSILAAIEDAGGPTERVHGRRGEAPRNDAEIGVHARRAGDVTGEHAVLLAGNRETLSLTHRAGDRGVFAEGALDAAAWLSGRDPGWYDFAEVLDGDGSGDVTRLPDDGGDVAASWGDES